MHRDQMYTAEDRLTALDHVRELFDADVEAGLLSEDETGVIRRWLKRQERQLTAKVEEDGNNVRSRRR